MSTHPLARRAAGLVFLLVLALLVWLSVAVYNKDFTETATVTVETSSAGNEMHPYAEVKLRGVVIGEVREITPDPDGDGARLKLALQPGQLRQVPGNVEARMLPTTLFGERYVSLVAPDAPADGALTDGDVIPQDRSANAIELEEVLRDTLPLLQAVKPDKLAATLHALAQALNGRGEQLGDTLVELDAHLKKLNPNLPTLNEDIRQLIEFSDHYAEAAPDLVQALGDAATTSATLAEKSEGLALTYGTVSTAAQDLEHFLHQNRSQIIRLSERSRPSVELLARYSPSFPCTLRTMADFVPLMDKVLGKGTAEPGVHIDVTVVPQRGKYVPGKDRPAYSAGGGPKCYSVPYTGKASTPRTAADASPTSATVTEIENGLGMPNSPEENELVNELLTAGAEQDEPLPDWSSLLAGPVFRGAEVTLK